MTPAEIKKTRLYRTLAPCVRKEYREELARMLAMVPEFQRAPLLDEFMSGTQLRTAFWWTDTKQGYDYWAEFSDSLRVAGHECW